MLEITVNATIKERKIIIIKNKYEIIKRRHGYKKTIIVITKMMNFLIFMILRKNNNTKSKKCVLSTENTSGYLSNLGIDISSVQAQFEKTNNTSNQK